MFTVMPSRICPQTRDSESGTIVLTQTPISTPTWTNNLDSSRQPAKLARCQLSKTLQAYSQWNGRSWSWRSGFTIYVSDNGGPLQLQTNSTTTSATFTARKATRTASTASRAIGGKSKCEGKCRARRKWLQTRRPGYYCECVTGA